MKIYRQGDVVIKEVTEIPKRMTKVKNGVILKGESTGHTHRLIGGDVLTGKDLMYLLVTKKGQIVHEEHNTIDLPKGKYMIIRQREYLSKDMVKIVVD